MLALAATWDTSLAATYGAALGAEFIAKGANVVLGQRFGRDRRSKHAVRPSTSPPPEPGPSVNVHRVPRGGRNAEYLAGEDADLGAELVRAYVTGVKSSGVGTTVKHFALNQQETNRDSQARRTSPPPATRALHISARSRANLGPIMTRSRSRPTPTSARCGKSTTARTRRPCARVSRPSCSCDGLLPPCPSTCHRSDTATCHRCAYNAVNGTHACGSRDLLARDLRERMGFEGWVMSDWRAAHNASPT